MAIKCNKNTGITEYFNFQNTKQRLYVKLNIKFNDHDRKLFITVKMFFLLEVRNVH